MSRLISKISKAFKGWHEKKITISLITTGLIVTASGFSQNWWLSLGTSLVNDILHTQLEVPNESVNYIYLTISSIIGLGLITLGLWFYFQTKDKDKKRSMLQILHSSIESVSYSNINKDFSDYNIEAYYLNQSEELKVIDKQNLQHALREQKKVVQKILNRLDMNSNIDVAYFGLAHIPLVMLLGYQMADKSNCSFFEWNQNKLIWGNVEEKKVNFPPLLLEKCESVQGKAEEKDVVVKIGITYPISNSDLDGLNLEGLNSYYLYLDPPHRNAIISLEQLHVYQEKFRHLLDEINQNFPKLEIIHLFYSGQPSLAYRLGSVISPRMDAEIWVYNHVRSSYPKYKWAINLKKIDQSVDNRITGEEVNANVQS